jgi:hypothetical protein
MRLGIGGSNILSIAYLDPAIHATEDLRSPGETIGPNRQDRSPNIDVIVTVPGGPYSDGKNDENARNRGNDHCT